MKYPLFLCLIFASVYSFAAQTALFSSKLEQFENIYQQQLGRTQDCQTQDINTFRVCSDVLRNEGNAPFILHHNNVTDKVIVLFHGLSDSPFFLGSIAQSLHQQGFNVVVALTPGHGKKHADKDMQDPNLADRWRAHVVEIMTLSAGLGDKVYIGGFSTGGTLAVEYSLKHPSAVEGVVLFSGALALAPSVEFLNKIWGIQWFAKLIDGEYPSIGRNPYKYPEVSRFAAFELLDLIFSVRQLLVQNDGFDLPVFSAHSAADATTLISGVKNLMSQNKGVNDLFEIPLKIDLCHADLVINNEQLIDMQFDDANLIDILPCDVPKANPRHGEMLQALRQFMEEN